MQRGVDSCLLGKIATAVVKTCNFDGREVAPSTGLAEDLALSRLGCFELALRLEEILDIELSDKTIEGFETVGDIVRTLSARFFQDVSGADIDGAKPAEQQPDVRPWWRATRKAQLAKAS